MLYCVMVQKEYAHLYLSVILANMNRFLFVMHLLAITHLRCFVCGWSVFYENTWK